MRLIAVVLTLLCAHVVWADSPPACPLPGDATRLTTLVDRTGLHDPASKLGMGNAAEELALAHVFPLVEAAGFAVWSAVRTHTLDGAPAFALLLVPEGAELNDEWVVKSGSVGIVTCRSGVWALEGTPFQFTQDNMPRLKDVVPVRLAGGAPGWYVHTFAGIPQLMEFYEMAWILGPQPSAAAPTRPAATWGELAHAEVARQSINTAEDRKPGDSDYIRNDMVGGSGFVPFAGGELWIAGEVFSDAPTRMVLTTPLWLDKGAPVNASNGDVHAWLFGAKGKTPEACAKLQNAGCLTLDGEEVRSRWGDPAADWFVGAWPDAAQAKAGLQATGITAKGGAWYWVGTTDDMPKRGPDGKPAREFVTIAVAKAQRPRVGSVHSHTKR